MKEVESWLSENKKAAQYGILAFLVVSCIVVGVFLRLRPLEDDSTAAANRITDFSPIAGPPVNLPPSAYAPPPTPRPTLAPTPLPTRAPTRRPTHRPTMRPTTLPPTHQPTEKPSFRPSINSQSPTSALFCESEQDCFTYGGFCDLRTNVCTSLNLPPLSECNAPLDCSSGACGFFEFGRFSESRVCCYQDIHAPSQVCNGVPPNRQCGFIDSICASGSCLAGVCTGGFQGTGETCDSDPDCGVGQCGLRQANPEAGLMCCTNAVTNVVVPWSRNRVTICGNLAPGADCVVDAVCASRVCASGVCI